MSKFISVCCLILAVASAVMIVVCAFEGMWLWVVVNICNLIASIMNYINSKSL